YGSGKESRARHSRVDAPPEWGLRPELVLVDQPAEHVAAASAIEIDHVGERLVVAEWRPLSKRPVRPVLGEMSDVGGRHVLEGAAADDQQPVETLAADAADPALCVGARLRRPHRRLDDADAFGAEDLVELAAELAIAITDQKPRPDALVVELHQQVARP